jgi:hypothetical protein
MPVPRPLTVPLRNSRVAASRAATLDGLVARRIDTTQGEIRQIGVADRGGLPLNAATLCASR